MVQRKIIIKHIQHTKHSGYFHGSNPILILLINYQLYAILPHRLYAGHHAPYLYRAYMAYRW